MNSGTASGSWHVDPDSLRSWVDGEAGSVVSVSVEQHVLHCALCRGAVAGMLPDTLRPSWDDVLAAVEVPRRGPIERLLVRLGVSHSDSLVVSSAPTLRVAWLAGTIGVLFFAVLAASLAHEGGLGLFLMVAPLIPVTGVAAAYGPSSDPSYEAVVAAPYAMVRLVLLRTVSVLVTSVPLVVAAGLLLPTSPLAAVAWLLPSAGFIAVVLTASNWVDPAHAAATVGVGWIATVAWAARTGDPMAVFAPAALVTYLAVLGVAVLTLLHRLLSATPSWSLR
ncbi:MAG: hypothetical protein ACXV4A_02590 [Actinomycetes bacterium]